MVPQAKQCGWPLQAGKGKETDLPCSLQKEPAFLDFSPVRPILDPDLNFKRIKVHCFKLLSLRICESSTGNEHSWGAQSA